MESEYREGAPGGQARKPKRSTKTTGEPSFTAAMIDPNTIYSTEAATKLIGISEAGLVKWKEMGLEYLDHKKMCTLQDRFLGCWLLEFMNRQKTTRG